MARRTAIHVEGFGHRNPIPAACRVGNIIESGGIRGVDAEGHVPPGLEDQCRLMFANVRRIVEAGGGSMDDIVKLTVWLQDADDRSALNKVWLDYFPDPASRPARHTMQQDMPAPKLVDCVFTAVLP
jgi:2-iminobutanoate/2-iminopropanoate deaminase